MFVLPCRCASSRSHRPINKATWPPLFRHTTCFGDCVCPGLSYLLPIRSDEAVDEELIRYLDTLIPRAEVIVVDGSPPLVFDDFARRCHASIRHAAPDADLAGCANGKVA